MKQVCILIPLAFTLLLAACGGTTQTDPVPAAPPTIDSFTASPPTISTAGDPATLNWSISGGYDTLQLTDSASTNTINVSGTSFTVNPQATTTYRLTAANSGGSATRETTVVLQGTDPTPQPTPDPVDPPTTPTDPPTNDAPVVNSFAADPGTITAGQSTTLVWSVSNSEIIRITPDPGQGDLSAKTSVTVSPTETTVYTMEAVSLSGLTATAAVTVTVSGTSEPQPPTSDVPYYGRWIVTFRSDVGTSFIHELDIDTASTTSTLDGGVGEQTLCLDDEDSTPCDDDSSASGTGFIGNLSLDDGSAPLTLAIFSDLSGASKLKLLTIGDAQLGTDS